MYEVVYLEIQTSVCDSIVDWTGLMCNDMGIYRECIEVDRPCSMCFCYRSCEGVEERQGDILREQKLRNWSLGRPAPLCSGADI